MARKARNKSVLDEFLRVYIKEHRPGSASPSVSTGKPVERGSRRLIFALIILGALVGTATTVSWPHLAPGPASLPINRLSAALIDELSLTDPDPAFLANVTSTLTGAGYHVDYYQPTQATVNFFRNLPIQGYGIIIIRSHSSPDAIITSQPYSESQYVWPQLTGGLSNERISNGYDYFAITESFVANEMQGNFQGAIIIVMGCQTLKDGPGLGAAFIQRGAGAYVGWDNSPSLQYDDMATAHLMKSMTQGTPVDGAVQTLGSDPLSHSHLVLVDSSALVADQLASTLELLRQLTMAAALIIPAPIVLGLILRRLWRL